MATGASASWTDSDLSDLVSGLGGKIACIEEITRLTSERQLKASFKLCLADGRTLKARLYPSEEKRRRVTALLPLLAELPFARVIAARGRATLEEWVEGTPLQAGKVTQAQARQAGELLGFVHAHVDVPEGSDAIVADADWQLDKIKAHLSAIATQMPEASAICEAVGVIAWGSRPAGFDTGLIHADYCAENIVLSDDGNLVVVDNELLRVGALDFDVARCCCRWLMTNHQRRAFFAGYEQHRGLDQFIAHRQFWAIRALALSMDVHLKHGRTNEPVMSALQRIASGDDARIWPV